MVTRTWNVFGDGRFDDPNSWFPAGAPSDGDLVGFEIPADVTVTFPGHPLGLGPADFVAGILWLRAGNITFTGSAQVDRGPTTFTLDTGDLSETDRGLVLGVLTGDTGQLHLRPADPSGLGLATLRAAAATVGGAPGSTAFLDVSTGTVVVYGSDIAETELIVGNHGDGTLTLSDGAALDVTGFNSRTAIGHHADGVGVVTIIGPGTTWTNANELWVGGSGSGVLVIRDGGRLRCGSAAGFTNIIGTFPGASGTVTVEGAGSIWTYGNGLVVGNGGAGILTVAGGGRLVSNVGAVSQVGSDGAGTVTITGPGSTWSTNGALHVGSTGVGALEVADGAQLTSGSATLRGLNDGSGQVLVTGTGSRWSVPDGSLTIGSPEAGFTTGPTGLTVIGGATVDVRQTIAVDTKGVLQLHGGTLAADEIDVRGGGLFDWTSGTLDVHVVDASLTNPAGTLAPRVANGGAAIGGSYTQLAGAELDLEIGGTAAGTQYSFVGIDGPAVLDGELRLSLVNGFVPAASDTFTVLGAFGIQGEFKNVADGGRLTTADGAGSFLVRYEPADQDGENHIVLSDFAPAGP
jgi:T5SS/PEP-CTERM-associated repeat protein